MRSVFSVLMCFSSAAKGKIYHINWLSTAHFFTRSAGELWLMWKWWFSLDVVVYCYCISRLLLHYKASPFNHITAIQSNHVGTYFAAVENVIPNYMSHCILFYILSCQYWKTVAVTDKKSGQHGDKKSNILLPLFMFTWKKCVTQMCVCIPNIILLNNARCNTNPMPNTFCIPPHIMDSLYAAMKKPGWWSNVCIYMDAASLLMLSMSAQPPPANEHTHIHTHNS